jgi:microcystin-dependent protein
VQDGTISRELTQAQYDVLPDETKRDGTVYYVTDATPFVLDNADYGYTPIGTIISVMGNSAPRNYLVCNGQTVNILDYPELANYFETQFGSKNHFGGDGTTTFALPDLRGEFLRGTGTNSHTNQGNGGDVGEHQDGTEHSGLRGDSTTVEFNRDSSDKVAVKYDTLITNKTRSIVADTKNFSVTDGKTYTSRPTNTSVLYCIAYRNIYITHEHIDERNKYSETEKVIGEWIDGKPLYQKTIGFTIGNTTTQNVAHNISNLDFGQIIWNFIINDADNTTYSFLDSNWFNSIDVGKTDISFVKTGALHFNTSAAYVTIQYTKTTD